MPAIPTRDTGPARHVGCRERAQRELQSDDKRAGRNGSQRRGPAPDARDAAASSARRMRRRPRRARRATRRAAPLRTPPSILVVSCDASGSVVDRRIATAGQPLIADSSAMTNVAANTIRSSARIDAVLDPAEDADDERRQPGGEKDDDGGEPDDLQAVVALALGARPRLRHVHEASGARDFVAGNGHGVTRFTACADDDRADRRRRTTNRCAPGVAARRPRRA